MNMLAKHLLLYAYLLLVFSSAMVGCGYGEVSPEAYEYSKALYSITNRKAEGELDEVTAQIAAAVEQGELPRAEGEMLQAIVDKAGEGNWEAANRDSRALMEAQIQSR